MSSRRPRGINASRWDREESSREHTRSADEYRPSRKGPGGLIFMCNSKTKRDCFHYKVLGLPLSKRDLVEQVAPGILLFLFDIDARELHGIFEASSHGGLSLEPKAFQGQGSYPAQVRFNIYRECMPLPENVFRGVIQENYFARSKFNLELTSDQVSRFLQLFKPIEAPRKRLHFNGPVQEADGQRLDLLERAISAQGGIELANRLPQYRLPAPGSRMEERLPRHDSVPRLEAHAPPAVGAVERLPLPHLSQKDLLTQGRLEEVDQLALRYLQQGNSSAGRALDPLHRNAGLVEAPRVTPAILQEEAILRSRVLEAERLRRAAAEQAILREQESLHSAAGPSRGVPSYAAGRPPPVGMSGRARHSEDIRRRW